MTLVIVACVFLCALAIVRNGGTDDPPEQPQTGGAVLQAHIIPNPNGLPIPNGPPLVVGFFLGLFVIFIGWALWQ